jgi:uncharacterized protein
MPDPRPAYRGVSAGPRHRGVTDETWAVSDDRPVVNNEAEHRFEIEIDGELAELVYHRHGNRLVIVHTGVPDALEGHGVGGLLVTAAIDHAAQHGWTVVPRCPFARGWLEHHPEVAGRATIDWGPERD